MDFEAFYLFFNSNHTLLLSIAFEKLRKWFDNSVPTLINSTVFHGYETHISVYNFTKFSALKWKSNEHKCICWCMVDDCSLVSMIKIYQKLLTNLTILKFMNILIFINSIILLYKIS